MWCLAEKRKIARALAITPRMASTPLVERSFFLSVDGGVIASSPRQAAARVCCWAGGRPSAGRVFGLYLARMTRDAVAS